VLADSEATRADLLRLLGAPPEQEEGLYSGADPRLRPAPVAGERNEPGSTSSGNWRNGVTA